ncbi:MAG TPA: NAAT family transporter [Thermoplasmata archaeon]|nr:NAAT family transporter [Thermoplasmata archaeon]
MAGDLTSFGITTFVAIFAIVNPVGAMTFFVVLTRAYPKAMKKRVIQKAILAATITLLVFAFVGNYIFLVFGTSIPAFRIAGGALLFTIAFAMMQGERSGTQLTARDRQEALEREAVGVVPLGLPMLAGPGAITTVMVLMAEASSPALDMARILIILASIGATMVIAWIMLAYSDAIFHRIGRMGAYAISRIMGLILAAIAVQFIILGVQGAYLEYFKPIL